jgi:hypothetical protein
MLFRCGTRIDEVDPSRRRSLGNEGVRLLRHVEDVAEALDGNAGLLEFLPKSDQTEHRLTHATGEHLEGHQHADGESFVPSRARQARDRASSPAPARLPTL